MSSLRRLDNNLGTRDFTFRPMGNCRQLYLCPQKENPEPTWKTSLYVLYLSTRLSAPVDTDVLVLDP